MIRSGRWRLVPEQHR